MPRHFSDDLDQPFVGDAFPDFTGGLASAPAAKTLQQNQYAYAENMVIDTIGRIATRKGRAMESSQPADGGAGGSAPAAHWRRTAAACAA